MMQGKGGEGDHTGEGAYGGGEGDHNRERGGAFWGGKGHTGEGGEVICGCQLLLHEKDILDGHHEDMVYTGAEME